MLSSSIETLIGEPEVTDFSTGFIPIMEKVKISPLFALMEYFPSMSVTVPMSFPLTCTVTPGKGSFVVASIIIPFISTFCAITGIDVKHRNKNSK